MTNLITADFNGTQVQFQSDAYINATSIAKRFKKQPKDYLKSSRTKEYINALINLHKSNRTKILLEENQLVRIKNGSVANGGGTWLHPKLAIDFARWLSAEFAVWCDEQIEKILHGMSVAQSEKRLSTSEERTPLHDIVHVWSVQAGLIYSKCWKKIHAKFGVSDVDKLTVTQVGEAVKYIEGILEGELMPKEADTSKLLIPFNKSTYADYHVMIRHGTAKKLQIMYVEDSEDTKQTWWFNG